MSLYGGIDLHANNSMIVLLNEQDQVMYQQRVANHLPTILEQRAPYHADIKGVVVESTYNWYWLVDGLMDADYRVHLANPAAMQQYSGLKYTDDRSDARWLAPLLRLGVLPKGYIYPKAERAVRDLLRKQSHLVGQHTSHVLSVQNILVRNPGHRFGAKQIHNLSQQDLEGLLPGAEQVLSVSSSLRLMECLKQQIKTLEQAVPQAPQTHAGIRAAVECPWHRRDIGPDDRPGNRSYWSLSCGWQLRLVLPLCQEYENEQW